MNLTVYSSQKLKETMSKWEVPSDFADPILNYLVYGFEPGSCFTAVLANDFMAAITHSHPANNIVTFKALVGWISDYMPVEAYGSYAAVKSWIQMHDDDRRTILENYKLIYTTKEEVWKILTEE